MYLVDTNIWLERLLDQKKSEDVKKFLSAINPGIISISDFSFHSIAVIMTKLGRGKEFLLFTNDVFCQQFRFYFYYWCLKK